MPVHSADCASAPGWPRAPPGTQEGTRPPKEEAAASQLAHGVGSKGSAWGVGRRQSNCLYSRRSACANYTSAACSAARCSSLNPSISKSETPAARAALAVDTASTSCRGSSDGR